MPACYLKPVCAAESIGKRTALGIPAVAGAVDRIGNVVAMLPIRLYKANPDSVGGRQVEEVLDDPRLKLLNTDSGAWTRSTKKQLTEDYLLDIGGFWFIDGTANNLKALRYVQPGNIRR